MRKSSSGFKLPSTFTEFDKLPSIANVRRSTVEALYGCSGSTLLRLIKRGLIPKPRKISERISVWRVGDLRASLETHSRSVADE
jgi:predicted DNA-binding transcriptional regulator AlpA